ncbi:MAG: alpha/beta hydrolase [Actinomycetota bacterium]|nr:alpha/beta hydrolase [Actinomycetota bacterium]
MPDIGDLARNFLYYPDRLPRDMPPPSWALGPEEVWMECDDGVRIHGLWWPEPQEGPAILFLHGNAQEVYSWSLIRRELLPLGCRLLLIDYHGYGKSGGEPHEAGLYLDGKAAMAWLHDGGLSDTDIIVFGKSLGGAVACHICQDRGLRALILESTFASLRGVASRLFPMLPPGVPLGEEYPSIERIARARSPVMVIHGSADELIPVEEGEAIFEAAPEPKDFYLVRGAGHNDVSMVAGADYTRRIGDFLDGI